MLVALAIVEAIQKLDLRYPAVDAAAKQEFAACRKLLLEE